MVNPPERLDFSSQTKQRQGVLTEETQPFWTTCPDCQGRGRKRKGPTKKARLRYERTLARFKGAKIDGTPPSPPKSHVDVCLSCKGSGLTGTSSVPVADPDTYPHIAIVGGGIGGVALAVACQHRGIPFTLYERDSGFEARSQGYGLTLQQATKAIKGLGLSSLVDGITSTRHLVHTPEGKVIGEWGVRKWVPAEVENSSKRRNVHIARQSLRLALLNQLHDHDAIQWGHRLLNYEDKGDVLELSFEVDGKTRQAQAGLVVGADGIRSTVRNLAFDQEVAPLRYLGCIVILGICPLSDLESLDCHLLDSATVFQTANGHERIYMMPYSEDAIMWQLSFPLPEEEAKALSANGPQALKEEACRRTPWHTPIPEILLATTEARISGYPVYDRETLEPANFQKCPRTTLIGDAAHPMSPFKGQGANQALIDALSLARKIADGCRPRSNWRETGLREAVLNEFETEMLERSEPKVKDSAAAAKFLHSDVVLHEGDEPRGRCLRRDAEH